jgi:hypothetical protein
MLICAGLSPDLTCEEQLALLCQLMRANADDRGNMKKSIGQKAGELLSQKNKSSDSIREELAAFIKNQIIKKSELRRHRRK